MLKPRYAQNIKFEPYKPQAYPDKKQSQFNFSFYDLTKSFAFYVLQNGYTPLHQAAQQGNTHIINVLLQHGAKPSATTVVRKEKMFTSPS